MKPVSLDSSPSLASPSLATSNLDFYIGVDVGTSGVRAIAIDAAEQIVAQGRWDGFPGDGAEMAQAWRTAVFDVIRQIPVAVRQRCRAIAINGTSGTVLWCDEQGNPVQPPILYNDDRGQSVMGVLRAIAPRQHIALSPTSSLAKLLWWSCQAQMQPLPQRSDSRFPTPSGYLLHQADWLAFLLHGRLGISDYHNSLKLGYDVGRLCYPEWMKRLPAAMKLPQVVAPGTPLGTVVSSVAAELELLEDCQVCAGTTDSIAAFLASGVREAGEAVTSLGSTLVIKLLSDTRVDAADYGIYSHRLGSRWLVGGASNTGGAVLRHFFTPEELRTLSDRIDPQQPSDLDYYPLLSPGERFPISNPNLKPRLKPRPTDDVEFLHGLLESMARIEAQGYHLLQELGASPLTQVYSAGGGAQNAVWTQIRQRHLGVPVGQSAQPEAAFGTARLAKQGMTSAQ